MLMRPRRGSEPAATKSGASASINLASKLFRKNRAKMSTTSSSLSSDMFKRPVRLRRLNGDRIVPSAGGSGSGVIPAPASSSLVALSKEQAPPPTPTQVMIRKLYDRLNREHKADHRESIKQSWKENVENLNEIMKDHDRLQMQRAASSSTRVTINPGDILEATKLAVVNKSTTVERIKVIIAPEAVSKSPVHCERVPVITIGTVSQIPPVLDWTAIPHNLHEDDGKFLTNIPFLGDEFIDKDTKFIDEMVTLYEGKVHEASDPSTFKKMNDEVLYTLIQAMTKIEGDEGPNVFKEENCGSESILEESEERKMICEEKVEQGDNDECQKKTTFSDVAAKVLLPEISPSKNPIEAVASSPGAECKEEIKVEASGESMKIEVVEPMEVEVIDLEAEESDQGPQTQVDESPTETQEVNQTSLQVYSGKPSEAVFNLLSSTFKGLGAAHEIREKYEIMDRAKQTQQLPILPNGMEQQSAAAYSIPNVEGPYAKYLPKEATMHAYQILFCRRCFTYDCKRHNGDDQVDVKYYRNRQAPAHPAPVSSSSSSTAFNYVCENPDCCQLTEMNQRNSEEVLSEWSPGDRSLFLCFFDSYRSNYCFIAFLMRNKTCSQVKEYANLENVPVTESCPRTSSRKPKHRKQRLGFTKKFCSSSNKRSVTRRWINNVKKTEKSKEEGGIKSAGGKLPPRYIPCLHENGGECDASCTCRINKTSCEKFCTCSLTCPYRFPGCRCTSTCDSKRCICFAAARECDPDLCWSCGAHEDDLGKISCHNVNIQRKLHKHLLMGRSDISGWGIYIKNDAQKGDFIAEYRGELISHDESERRGHVYDKIQHTFLFELNDHFVVDATRKGNKSRFANSSKNPNCEVKRMLVNGDHRIGIYAKRFIEAGEELFYDYEDVLEKQQKAAEGASRKMVD